MTRWHYRREWLNRPTYQSTASVIADIRDEEGDFMAELALSDCTRKIELDFNIYNYHDLDAIANVAHKSRVLRREVNDFLDQVDRGVALQRRRRRLKK